MANLKIVTDSLKLAKQQKFYRILGRFDQDFDTCLQVVAESAYYAGRHDLKETFISTLNKLKNNGTST